MTKDTTREALAAELERLADAIDPPQFCVLAETRFLAAKAMRAASAALADVPAPPAVPVPPREGLEPVFCEGTFIGWKDAAVPVQPEDANNYCRILTLLGMEEEGDPVAEVRRLIATQCNFSDPRHPAAIKRLAQWLICNGHDEKRLLDIVALCERETSAVDLLQTDAYAEGRRDEQEELASVLPGIWYMDPPDGGAPTILEQLQRQAKDASRFRWLTADHGDAATREKCREILYRMPTMSYSAACYAIDGAVAEYNEREAPNV